MDVIFQAHPTVTLAGNHFICQVVIQWEEVPLMEVGQFQKAGFTTKFAVYHSDGTKIAVVKGAQIYPTEEGKAALVTMRHEPNLTACELEGRTIFELRRQGAAALKGAAELYTPEGAFIKCNDSGMKSLLDTSGGSLAVIGKGPDGERGGTIIMTDSTIEAPIGILFRRSGAVSLGVGQYKPE
jgi:hypothetical protein